MSTLLTRALHDPQWVRQRAANHQRALNVQLADLNRWENYWTWVRDALGGRRPLPGFETRFEWCELMLKGIPIAEAETRGGTRAGRVFQAVKDFHCDSSSFFFDLIEHGVQQRNRRAKGGRSRKILATAEDVRQAETFVSQVRQQHPDWRSESSAVYDEAAKRLRKHRPDLVKRAEHFSFKLTGITLKRAIQSAR